MLDLNRLRVDVVVLPVSSDEADAHHAVCLLSRTRVPRMGGWSTSSRSVASSGAGPLCRERRKRPIQPCQDRPHAWIGCEQRRHTSLPGDTDGGRQSIRRRRPRTDHRHVDKAVGTRTGAWIKNMMEAPARLECRTITTRYG